MPACMMFLRVSVTLIQVAVVASELPTLPLLSKLPYLALKTSLLQFIMTLRRQGPWCTSGT